METASDRRHRNKLWPVMEEKMQPAYLTKTVQSLCQNTKFNAHDRCWVGNKYGSVSILDMGKDWNEVFEFFT
jgi:hypothetical protein